MVVDLLFLLTSFNLPIYSQRCVIGCVLVTSANILHNLPEENIGRISVHTICGRTNEHNVARLLWSAYVIIGINSIGLVMEATYIIFYLVYAPRKEKMFTLRLVTFFNIGGYSLVALATNFLAKDHHNRVRLLGTICAAFNLAEFAAPLAIMRRVIKTKSVEYMPFTLSFTLTLCAALWFLYGFLRKDFFIAVPSMVGFAFGIAQLILYLIYKDSKKNMEIPKQQGGGSTGTSVDLKGTTSKNDNGNQHIEKSSEPEHMKSNENNV
ncbi:hypothetical protein Tsubulata_016115 [Turnera subulata]|uniref:Bidirectional sugar transporter SWEET n=1 Tax=Turnera subulata TaxID=218843 RepID=A0A9Q0GH06_9ROSI|nr:hypothetical protein Tsubulata_016115 [Turnera subulata]